MDPREALILSLKREINALQLENEHLKSALHLHSDMFENAAAEINHERKEIPTAPKVNLERMTELEINEIIELVKLYIAENEALRTENSELFNTRDIILRDQEIVCRENERLLKKLEDVNSWVSIKSMPSISLDRFLFVLGVIAKSLLSIANYSGETYIFRRNSQYECGKHWRFKYLDQSIGHWWQFGQYFNTKGWNPNFWMKIRLSPSTHSTKFSISDGWQSERKSLVEW